MAFTVINASEIDEGSPITTSLLTKIKDSLDDLNVRLEGIEYSTVNSNNNIASRNTPLYQLGDTSGGAFTSTLPAAADMTNRILIFKKTSSDSYGWTIDGYSAETIDDAASYTITRQYDSILVVSDASEWWIITGVLEQTYVQPTVQINTTAPLAGGGTLASDLTLSISNIANADIAAAAGIPYSKLNLSNGIVNADVVAAAGIPYSKLNLTGGIVNADIVSAAGIPYSKLNLTGSLVDANFIDNAGGKTVSSVDPTTDTITASNHGMKDGDTGIWSLFHFSTTGTPPSPLVNDAYYRADVTGTSTFKPISLSSNGGNGSYINITTAGSGTHTITPVCGIYYTQIEQYLGLLPAAGTSKSVVTNGSGVITAGGSSSTAIGYLSGLTSSMQTQLDGKITTTEQGSSNKLGYARQFSQTLGTSFTDIHNDNLREADSATYDITSVDGITVGEILLVSVIRASSAGDNFYVLLTNFGNTVQKLYYEGDSGSGFYDFQLATAGGGFQDLQIKSSVSLDNVTVFVRRLPSRE